MFGTTRMYGDVKLRAVSYIDIVMRKRKKYFGIPRETMLLVPEEKTVYSRLFIQWMTHLRLLMT